MVKNRVGGQVATMLKKQFKSTSLADQVYDQLENDIIQGVYAKGEILTELKLVEQLGVSRTPIRELLPERCRPLQPR